MSNPMNRGSKPLASLDDLMASMRQAQSQGLTPDKWLNSFGVSNTGSIEQMLMDLCRQRGLDFSQLISRFFGRK